MSHYEVLGVDPRSTVEEIHRAYLSGARQHHPDRYGPDDVDAAESEDRMRRVNAAWTVLSDPDRRADYDRSIGIDRKGFTKIADLDDTFVPHDDGPDDDDSWRFEPDDGDPRTAVGRPAILAPVVLGAAAVVALAAWILLDDDRIGAVAAMLAMLTVFSIVLVPLIAMAGQRGSSDIDRHMGTYLDAILEHHRARAAADTRSTDELIEACVELDPARGFRASLGSGDAMAVISEVKRRSPSKGDLAIGLDPAELAARYEAGGAACISVLTDGPHFGGSADDLRAARAAVSLPVIRKDFTVAPNDVCDARLMGADCVLLIVAALSDGELAELSWIATEVGLDVLVETHDEVEVERALAHTRGDLVGVNQRDLQTFKVDTARAVRVATSIPDDAVKVAESGIGGRADAEELAAAGYHAVLVGEHLVTSGDPASAVADLRVPRPPL